MKNWSMFMDLAGDYDDASTIWASLEDIIPKQVTGANLRRAAQLPPGKMQIGSRGPLQDPQQWMWLPLPEKKEDWYSKDMMRQFAEAAKKHKVDPLTYIALGMSETHLGNLNPENPAMIYPPAHFSDMRRIYGDEKFDSPEASIDRGAWWLGQGFKRFPKDQLSAIQSYSGTGRKIYPKSKFVAVTPQSKYFGKQVKDIDFWRDKPQAKRVVALMDALKKNPEFMDYLKQYYEK